MNKMIEESSIDIGYSMHELAKILWPINRSLTGEGVRKTLSIFKEHLPNLNIKEIPSGTQVFDWKIPEEWNVEEAWIEHESGRRIVDFKENNLHLVGYSMAVDEWMSLHDLQNHLHSIPEQPDAIPYLTSYYSPYWGFCLSDKNRKKLENGKYHVYIKSVLKPGVLNYGELIIPGEIKDEIFLSTYICHPSMANNELSGPLVTLNIAKWILLQKNHRYTYRIVFIPETIGSIAYISNNYQQLKENVKAGFNITCVGDERCYSYLPSRNGNTISDRVAEYVLNQVDPNFKRYSWLDRGSDERQYCAPGVDLPIASVMRSKYGEYPEYHTSLDDLNFVTPKGLSESLMTYKNILLHIENNLILKSKIFCEPHLSKRNLYPTLSTKKSAAEVATMMDFISYCDGVNDLIEISKKIKKPMKELLNLKNLLLELNLIEVV
jgi:aminopeptidase-like protein